jgi:inhibitor of KinA sporulation pathway (predicted exonuclease)
MPLPAHIVFFDTEFTTWEGALARQWSGPGEFREVVQIGAMRVDARSLTAVERFDVLVRPAKNPVLSDYFVQLTGITQAAVDATGLSLQAAVARFKAFIGESPAASYGDDALVIRENQQLLGLPEDFHARNIGPWFMEHGAAYGVRKGVNSGALARTVGAPLAAVVAEHNALEDVRSILAAYALLIEKGAPSFF